MTAEVEIAMPRRTNVLAVPAEAVRSEDGHDVCLVVHEDGLERREVKLGQVTRDMAEVTQGLQEGEQVVLNPLSEDVKSRCDFRSFGPTARRNLGLKSRFDVRRGRRDATDRTKSRTPFGSDGSTSTGFLV